MGSPNLPACLPFAKTVDDPPTSVPPWQQEHLPQGLQCTAQLSPLLCIPLPLTMTSFDADMHGLGGQQPCPVHISPSVVIPANSILQKKVNYTFIYMNLYESATLEITEILFVGCFFSFYEEVCLYFSGAYHQSSSSTIPTCRNIHIEFSFYEFIGIFK